MAQKVSVLIYNPSMDSYVISKVYGWHGWTVPKGHIDNGENARQAAIREVKEECNITITRPNNMKLMGTIPYGRRQEHTLTSFYYEVNEREAKSPLRCNSYFKYNEDDVEEYPEVENVQWMKSESFWNVLDKYQAKFYLDWVFKNKQQNEGVYSSVLNFKQLI